MLACLADAEGSDGQSPQNVLGVNLIKPELIKFLAVTAVLLDKLKSYYTSF